MLDRRGEDLPRLVQAATGIEHVVDLGSVLRPLLDLIEVAVVRDERVAGLFVWQVVHREGAPRQKQNWAVAA